MQAHARLPVYMKLMVGKRMGVFTTSMSIRLTVQDLLESSLSDPRYRLVLVLTRRRIKQ